MQSGAADTYLVSVGFLDRLQRRLRDVVKDAFERRGRDDVNGDEALLLYNVGDKELTESELRTRGYYLGHAVVFHVKKLTERGFIERVAAGGRHGALRIRLTDRGREVRDVVAGLYRHHADAIEPVGGVSIDDLERLNAILARVERYWTDTIRFRL